MLKRKSYMIRPEFYEEVEKKANALGISVSGLVTVALAEYLKQDKALSTLDILVQEIKEGKR